MTDEDCRSPIGLDCCSCCMDLASGYLPDSLSPTASSPFRQLREQLLFQNLNTDKLNNIMRQDSLESVVRDPCFLLNEGICNSNIDQTLLSILLFFHSSEARKNDLQHAHGDSDGGTRNDNSGEYTRGVLKEVQQATSLEGRWRRSCDLWPAVYRRFSSGTSHERSRENPSTPRQMLIHVLGQRWQRKGRKEVKPMLHTPCCLEELCWGCCHSSCPFCLESPGHMWRGVCF
ncbi:uncharacterized protein LOC114767754 [Denticeps clupeoides]|uniref:uncharacterized protein LOC114767754 n=1 Tax=Denticeps clupeoides TaxID=299321 RepID=UPI0010A59C3A|nr:uncharacterized protein LOC114767754 [Denticeps clupeoides]